MYDLFNEEPLPESPQQGYQQSQPQPQNSNYQSNQSDQNSGYQQSNNNHQSNQGGYNRGGNNYNKNNNNSNYNSGSGGGYRKGGWTPPPDVVETPYRPVMLYVDRDFPDDIKNQFVSLATRLIGKGITVRYNADDLAFHDRMRSMGGDLCEVYIPFKGFNDVETKYYFNNATSKHIAETNFNGYGKLPNVVQSMIARNVRMMFGNKNDSPAMCVVTWSPDGATKPAQVTRETGRSSFVIQLAGTYGFALINIQDPNGEIKLLKGLNIE